MLTADKKLFFTTLHAIIEKSHDLQLLRVVLHIIGHWIKNGQRSTSREQSFSFDGQADASQQDSLLVHMAADDDESSTARTSQEDMMIMDETPDRQGESFGSALTAKEKCNFLLRMIRFDKLADVQLQSAFLELVWQARLSFW